MSPPLEFLAPLTLYGPHGQHVTGTCMQCFAFVSKEQGQVMHLKVRSLLVRGLILCLLVRVSPVTSPPACQHEAGGLF